MEGELISRMRVSNMDSEVKKGIVVTMLEQWLSKVCNEEEWMLDALQLLHQLHPSDSDASLITTTSSTAAAFINTKRQLINNLKLYFQFHQTRVLNNPPPSSPPHIASPSNTQLHKDKSNDAINLEEMDPTTNKTHHLQMDSSTTKVDPQEMDPFDSVTSHEVPNHTTSAPTNLNRPSFMESSSSPTSHKSNDSIEELLGGKSNRARRLHLPSPKRKRISPLKSYETPKIAIRRKVKRWSRLEEQTLKTAIRIYGEGNWKSMLDSYPDVFDERTTGDLKDKWRNMKLQRSK